MTETPLAEVADSATMSIGWSFVEVPNSSLDEKLTELRYELGLIEDAGPVEVIYATTQGVEVANAITKGPPNGTRIVLVTSLDALAEIAPFLDLCRGRFVGGPRVILVTPPSGGEMVARSAPNIWSWVGSRYWPTVEPMTGIDVEARLASLQTALGYTDGQVRQMVDSDTLPNDPAFAEWASLLSSGDPDGE